MGHIQSERLIGLIIDSQIVVINSYKALLIEAGEVLRSVEWHDRGYCPVCNKYQADKHKVVPACRLASLLAKIDAVK
jgi:hypothetical protein